MQCRLHPSAGPIALLNVQSTAQLEKNVPKKVEQLHVNLPVLHFRPRMLSDQSRGTCPAHAGDKKK